MDVGTYPGPETGVLLVARPIQGLKLTLPVTPAPLPPGLAVPEGP